jgi:hypothetical protein
VLLLIGVPLFVAMPPWTDVTLYQLAARNILKGGVHYRDIFDTNLPGFVWIITALEAAFGSHYRAWNAVDLCVIASAVLVLSRWVNRTGGTPATAAWFVAACALFYPFTTEYNHLQRDPWQLLPVALATHLRMNRATRSPAWRPVATAVVEGFLWGLAVWLKPHVVFPAFAVWVVSAFALARQHSRRMIAKDLVAVVCGGLLAGVPGLVWLITTGAWPHFLDVFFNWNPEYLADAGPVLHRAATVFGFHRPWSWLHYPAILFAVVALWESRVWSRVSQSPAPVRGSRSVYHAAETEAIATHRAILGVLYLAWMGQVILFQKPNDYLHIPLLLLAFAVVASQRCAFFVPLLCWILFVGALHVLADYNASVRGLIAAGNRPTATFTLDKHPLVDRHTWKCWPRVWIEGDSNELRDSLGLSAYVSCGPDWTEANEVAAFLRTVEPQLQPGELNCWHDGTHVIYLLLDLDPATRYIHYGTAFTFQSKREVIAKAVADSHQRYVVSDLMRSRWGGRAVVDSPKAWRDNDPLPAWLPPNEREKFPWNQPVVFRAGRYLVHRIDPAKPLGTIRVPTWDTLDRLATMRPDE